MQGSSYVEKNLLEENLTKTRENGTAISSDVNITEWSKFPSVSKMTEAIWQGFDTNLLSTNKPITINFPAFTLQDDQPSE